MTTPLVLPRGVTGFHGRQGEGPGTVDLKAFKQACFAAARSVRAKVIEVRGAGSDGTARSYHQALLRLDQGGTPQGRAPAILVLCNAHAPLIALADPAHHVAASPVFIDVPALAERLGQVAADLRMLVVADLEQPVTPESIAELNDAEVQQLRYWRPARIGDVVFNHWD